MKKKKFLAITIIALACLGLILGFKYSETYQFNVRKLTRVNVEQVSEMFSNNDSGIIYVGRSTCPGCVEFVPKLNEALSNNSSNTTVYYFDTDRNRELDNFGVIVEKLGVETVPTLVIIENGNAVQQIDALTLDQEELEIKLNNY